MIDTRTLEAFAASARSQLMAEVEARLTAVLSPASTAREEFPSAIKALEKRIRHHGGDAAGRRWIVEEQAYVWFNRIVALRFMDANGYTSPALVSPDGGATVGQPAVLAAAKRGEFDQQVFGSTERITGLLNGTITSPAPQEEAYGLLLRAYCADWNRTMPFMFAPDGDYTTLLMPADMLADSSVRAQAVRALTSEMCRDVEVIGWLYQFYIAERKAEVFAGFRKNQKAGAAEIPAATQLFTPDWIVRYLVENSVGRLWMLNHPTSHLIEKMDYYVEPTGSETDFLRITEPEQLTVMDPCCGSGHMLTYAFDLLYAIYEEEGYAPSEIPTQILTHNVYGTEIDPRAAALAAFALMMKARARQRRFLRDPVLPNIRVIEPVEFNATELNQLAGTEDDTQALLAEFHSRRCAGLPHRPRRRSTTRRERAISIAHRRHPGRLGSARSRRAGGGSGGVPEPFLRGGCDKSAVHGQRQHGAGAVLLGEEAPSAGEVRPHNSIHGTRL